MAGMRRTKEIPVSLEVVRRKVMLTIFSVERETDIFTKRYLSNVGECDTWIAFIKEVVCPGTKKDVSQLDDYKDLEPLLNKLKGDPEVVHSVEYSQVRRMCQRGNLFEYIAFSLRNDLVDAYEKYLQKYCLSFYPETRGEDLESVREYENKIIEWEKTTRERLEAVDAILDESDKLKKSIVQYLEQYDRVVYLMEETCKAMVHACQPMKRWVSADSSYVHKIREEINIYNRTKMERRDANRQQEFNHDQLGRKLKRRAWFTMKLDKMLKEVRDEKRRFRRKELGIRNLCVNLERSLQEHRNQLAEVKKQLRDRRENSPTIYNYLTGRIEGLRAEIRKLEGQREVLETQMLTLQQEQQHCQKEIDRLAGDVQKSLIMQDQALDKLQRQEKDIKQVKDDIKSKERKIAALKRIREIKLHSDTVKKIYHHGYHPGQMGNVKGDLEEAFKIAAEDVGPDWQWMYQTLPFIPYRDHKNKTRDIELIDLGNRQHDSDSSLPALKGLEKWRHLSSSASVPELLTILRKMKKHTTVHKIQRQLAQSAEM